MALVLDRRSRSRLIISGAVLGALIGPLGLWLDVRSQVRAGSRDRFGSVWEVVARWATSVWSGEGGWAGLFVLVVPFLATLVLMPRFVRWLETRLNRDRGRFYMQAGLAGIAFGAAVTALIALVLMIAAVIAGAFSTANLKVDGGVVAGGILIFGPIMGLFAPFLFIPSIVALGIPFGLLYGALVRRLARDGGPLDALG